MQDTTNIQNHIMNHVTNEVYFAIDYENSDRETEYSLHMHLAGMDFITGKIDDEQYYYATELLNGNITKEEYELWFSAIKSKRLIKS